MQHVCKYLNLRLNFDGASENIYATSVLSNSRISHICFILFFFFQNLACTELSRMLVGLTFQVMLWFCMTQLFDHTRVNQIFEAATTGQDVMRVKVWLTCFPASWCSLWATVAAPSSAGFCWTVPPSALCHCGNKTRISDILGLLQKRATIVVFLGRRAHHEGPDCGKLFPGPSDKRVDASS